LKNAPVLARTIVEARDSSHKNDRRIKEVLVKYLPEKAAK
jgi:hypothetical protein